MVLATICKRQLVRINRVGHSMICAEHPRPRSRPALEGFPCLKSALIVFVVGIELESAKNVRILVKSNTGSFVRSMRN